MNEGMGGGVGGALVVILEPVRHIECGSFNPVTKGLS